MSIAVSAVIKPSRLLRAVLAAYAAANLAVGVFLLSSAPGAFRVPAAVGACCLLAAAGAARGHASAGNMRRIDIFGVGEMRLTVQQKLTETAVQNLPVTLMPGSAVWPGLLMLLLRGEDGKTRVAAVLSDSVNTGEFRALAVAIRAIGAQRAPDQVLFEPHKIL